MKRAAPESGVVSLQVSGGNCGARERAQRPRGSPELENLHWESEAHRLVKL